MANLLTAFTFDRFTMQQLITPTEGVLALLNLNPYMRPKDYPNEHRPNIEELKRIVVRNIKAAIGDLVSANYEIDSTYVYSALFPFIDTEVTPIEIQDKAKQAIETVMYSNKWEDLLYGFGGEVLVEYGRSKRRSGRGLHRKDDEEKNNYKLMGILLKLLAAKQSGARYGKKDNPTISAIYEDICELVTDEGLNLKGIGKSTFYNKARQAMDSLNDD